MHTGLLWYDEVDNVVGEFNCLVDISLAKAVQKWKRDRRPVPAYQKAGLILKSPQTPEQQRLAQSVLVAQLEMCVVALRIEFCS